MSPVPVLPTTSELTRIRLFFDQASDEQFLVLAEILAIAESRAPSEFQLSTYDNEDVFLERVVAASLDPSDTSQVAGTVLLAIGDLEGKKTWVELNLNPQQRHELGLDSGEIHLGRISSADQSTGMDLAFDFADNVSQMHDFLFNAPSAFIMVSGPAHEITFVNQRCLDLVGRAEAQDLLGKPIRQALPELEGQVFFKLLDNVYRTGKAYTGVEALAHLQCRDSPGYEDKYFDFINQPVRNGSGEVSGIMVQATDVTERVLDREVREDREEQMFRQWAELDSIYREAPTAMALLDARSFQILRLNQRHAELMGSTVPELLGRSILKLDSNPPALADLFERLASGEPVRNAIFEKEVIIGSEAHRTWLINISPFFGAEGKIVAYTSISLEVPDEAPLRTSPIEQI
jgi:PAS domain-containing protein